MRKIRKIRFKGELESIIGSEVSVAIIDCRDLLSWMMNCYPETKRILRADNTISIGLIHDDKITQWIDEDYAKSGYIPECDSIVVIADVQGSGAEMAVALFSAFGSTILATSATAIIVGGIINIGISIALNMVIASLADKPDSNTSKEDQSYLLNGATNNNRAGCAVPLLFGRWRASTVVISQAVTAERMVITHPDEVNLTTITPTASGNLLANDIHTAGAEVDTVTWGGADVQVPCVITLDADHSISFARNGDWTATISGDQGVGTWTISYSVASDNSAGFSVQGVNTLRITWNTPASGYRSSGSGYSSNGVSHGNSSDSGSSGWGGGGGDAAGVGSGAA